MAGLVNGTVDLWYAERGSPAGLPVVLLHGLFFSRRMFDRLAAGLPDHRFLLLDLRGHGRSTRPAEAAAYSWPAMASDVTALLDHLGIDKAVVGGLSLGADVALAFAAAHPERLLGAVIEMPVLERGQPTADRVFRPMAAGLELAGRVLAPATAVSRPLRRTSWPELASLADFLSLEPNAGAAMLRSLLEHYDDVLAGVDALAEHRVPTLVVGHRFDALHPLADARYIVERVANAELAVVSSIAELRLRPGRYAEIVGRFLAGISRPAAP